MLGPRAFLGEACLAGQTSRINTATATEASLLIRIDCRTMTAALKARPDLSEALLKLGRFGHSDKMPTIQIPGVSHETLAEMVGTTRSRITLFMNKFRKLGLIEYDHESIVVRSEVLAEVILGD